MPKPARSTSSVVRSKCGLCGKTTHLTQTECCGNWICDDADQYVLFSFARNSCYRNHDLFTLCSYHHQEGHAGRWQDCLECRQAFETEMYVYYGTNEYNFEKLENPPAYEPTHCARCGKAINLGEDGYTFSAGHYLCERCAPLIRLEDFSPRQAPKRNRHKKSWLH